MAVQTSYNFRAPVGTAGGIFDLSPHAVDSRLNGETVYGKMKFGMGVVTGENPNKDVKIPEGTSEVSTFEGIIISTPTEMNRTGETEIAPLQTLSVMVYGRIWARLKDGVEPEYGEAVYLITSGDDAGLFTTEGDADDAIAINARYIGTKGSGNIAPVELYNQMRK